MRILFPLLLTSCITPYSGDCANGGYRTIKGDCKPITALTGDTGNTSVPDADTDTDSDTDSDTDTDTDTDTDLFESIDVSCDDARWYYSVATTIPAGSADLRVAQTGVDDEIERHTLALEDTSSSGGGVYSRELYLVADYYYEDTATQFLCIDGLNPNLTWRIDLYVDPSYSSHMGCVSWGHNPSYFQSDGCAEWGTP